MRTLVLSILMLSALTFAYAGEGCGTKAGCSGCSSAKMAVLTAPDCAPAQLKSFTETLVPMSKAREANSDSYIRENAKTLAKAAKVVAAKSDPCCPDMKAEMKAYKTAAKVMAKDASRLNKLAKKGSTEEVLAQMKVVEDDFVQLAACCQ